MKSKRVSIGRGNTESAGKWPRRIGPFNDPEKQEILEAAKKGEEQCYDMGMSCSERTFAPVLHAFEKWADFPKEVIRLSSAFGGGGANTGYGLCGAVTGGLMGLSLFWGRVEPMDYFRTVGLNSVKEARENPILRDEFYRIFNFFMKEFKDSFGSVICADLIKDYLDSRGFYILVPKLQEERAALCKRITTWTVSRVAQLILEGQEKGIQHMKMGHNKWNME
jgi:C_GCAxxG_C_C family probable redox protein